MSIKKQLIIFVLGLLLFTLVYTPAAFVVGQFTLPKGVAYKGLSGSIWNGSAEGVQVAGQQLKRVKWQFQPASLLFGKFEFDVSFGNARNQQELSGRASVAYGFTGLTVQQATLRASANKVKPFLPFPVGDLNGRLLLEIAQYSYASPLCDSLVGSLSWLKAGVDINGSIDLGMIDTQLACEQGQIHAQFNGQNSLGLEGNAIVAGPAKFSFDGYLKPSAELPALVHQGIGFFGKQDNKGRYKVRL